MGSQLRRTNISQLNTYGKSYGRLLGGFLSTAAHRAMLQRAHNQPSLHCQTIYVQSVNSTTSSASEKFAHHFSIVFIDSAE